MKETLIKTHRKFDSIFKREAVQHWLVSPDVPEKTKTKLRAEHAQLDRFELKKSIEVKLK